MSKLEQGACLCGAVKFEGVRSGHGIGVCHCKMCRIWASGPYFALRFEGGVRITEKRGLKWFASSDIGRRGFCSECGSSLFWAATDAVEGDYAVSAGTIEDRSDEKIKEHIFVDMQPEYYGFSDNAPRLTSEGSS